MIGTSRLERIARRVEAGGSERRCRGRFVLEAQRELYGSRFSVLPRQELQEILDFLELPAKHPEERQE